MLKVASVLKVASLLKVASVLKMDFRGELGTSTMAFLIGAAASICIIWIVVSDARRVLKATTFADGIEELQRAFASDCSLEEIQAKIFAALRVYGLECIAQNIAYAGAALTAVRHDCGIAEVRILDAMIMSPLECDFAEAASFCGQKLSVAEGFPTAGDVSATARLGARQIPKRASRKPTLRRRSTG